ncbi:hypothetical protein KGF56_003307 [Candida oxycetoniae]|uniref:Ribophorin II C-terminal domain-containing protein n=1 Tax=Candida oxycetoniae TaxID=497107 RepID=A0AAI9WX52_9ASCO|nr:uncharacterized protein KGF56_003307 [Candida oxycetoniae]KAI3403877.2 hypothetical protein KGF56_003307 [Candida oxycetoniae]
MHIKKVIPLSIFALHALASRSITGSVSIDDKAIHFGEIDTQEVKVLPIESAKDSIKIHLKDNALDKTLTPEQIMFTLADAEKPSTSTHFVPVVKDNSIDLVIPAATIPDILKSKNTLVLSLTIADSKKELNLVKRLLELKPSSELQSASKYTKKNLDFGLQPEIHHIFREDEKTVNPVVPIVFIAASSVIFLALIASWVGFIGVNEMFKTLKTTSSRQLLQNICFLLSLLGFEINFVQYYLGQSIFTTLLCGFILSFPCLNFGRSVSRALARNRALGKQ